MNFKLTSKYKPTGDQPEAIRQLTDGINRGDRAQVLLGVTGSGKTFTMANVIANVNKPTLILSHNKTLAAQLYDEMRGFFPDNAVEYYVSYYEETPAYHPEEGGYYVATCELIDSEEFNNLEDAKQRIAEKAAEDVVEKISDEFYLDRSKYIGGDRFYIIETEKGSEEKGDTIYQ